MIAGSLINASLGLAARYSGLPSLAIVTYHRVLAEPDPMLPSEPDVVKFGEQVRFLSQHLNVVPLRDAMQRLRDGSLPPRALSITFDDGYANNLHNALPVLQALRVPATVFVATGYLDGGCMWNDVVIETFRSCCLPVLDLDALGLGVYRLDSLDARRVSIRDVLDRLKYRPVSERTRIAAEIATRADVTVPRSIMLTSPEVRALHEAGIEIGGHTVSHPILSRLPPHEAAREIGEGAAKLFEITGSRPTLFAYPNGRPGLDFGPEHESMVRDAGFTHAFTTQWGVGRQGANSYRVPRITLWNRSATRLTANLIALYARSR